ncbi:MAG: hypothetical protein KBC50_01985 [Candidatus Pacebacteria bacterium]|nr:hypothetical protein [Candidatus Paceibacterota bacterium]
MKTAVLSHKLLMNVLGNPRTSVHIESQGRQLALPILGNPRHSVRIRDGKASYVHK